MGSEIQNQYELLHVPNYNCGFTETVQVSGHVTGGFSFDVLLNWEQPIAPLKGEKGFVGCLKRRFLHGVSWAIAQNF